MRITENDFTAAIDTSADSSATADVVKRLTGEGRVIIQNVEGTVRSILVVDGKRGMEIIFSVYSTAFVCKQISDNGFIII